MHRNGNDTDDDLVIPIYPNSESGICQYKISDAVNPDEHIGIVKSSVLDHEISRTDENYRRYTFEEAVKAAGHGKFHYYALAASGVSLLALVAELIGIGYSAPSAKCDMKFTTAQQGVLNSTAFLGFVCSSHLWGFLADTWGRRKSLRLSLLSTFIFSVLSSFSISISMLIATRFLTGFCVAGIQSAALPYLGEFHSNQTRPRAITFASMFMTLSIILMSLISWIIIPMKWTFSLGFILYTPWRFNIVCISLLSLSAFLMIGILPESPKFLLSLGKETDAINVIKQIYRINSSLKSSEGFTIMAIEMESIGSNLADTNLRNVVKLMWKQTWPLFLPPHLKNMMLISYLSFVLYGIAHGMNMWLPHIYNVLVDYIDKDVTMCEVISNTLRTPALNASISSGYETNNSAAHVMPNECSNIANPLTFKMLLAFGAFLIFVYVIIGFFIKWISIKTITTIGLLACASCGIFLIWSNDFYATYGFMSVLLCCGNFSSLLGGLSQDLFPTNLKAMAVCFIFMFGRIGSVAGSNLIGLLINTNCTLILLIYGVVLFSCAVLCFLFLKTSASK